MENQTIFGTTALENRVPFCTKPVLRYPGKTLLKEYGFGVDNDTFSRHILLLGGSGCGKTNAFLYAMDDVRKSMTRNDLAIIFDTKGEFFDRFFRPGDYVIGNSVRFRPRSHTWNLFDEVLADGWDEDAVSMNAREISAALFHGRGSSTQPFFCDAARDIFRGIVIHFIRMAQANPMLWRKRLNNAWLLKAFQEFTVRKYLKIFQHYPDMRGMTSYFGDGTSNQALGVFGELNSMISEYFTGILAEHNPERSISMREAVRRRGGKAIFIEYDLSLGESLTPIYRLLLDQALKEALGRNPASGNGESERLFVFADEFKLLPKLQHIDDALNFGRGLGLRIMAGIQSIDQLYDVYGRERGAVIAGGFGSLFAFHTNDASSREYIQKRFGSNMQAYQYNNSLKNAVVQKEREGYTVELWDQMNLGVGQAFIGLGYEPPFFFQFDEYGK